jgi:hypothetical protein
MNPARALRFFRSGEFLYNRNFALLAWFGLSLFAVIRVDLRGELNIYEIYKYSLPHIIEHRNLYVFSNEYGDQFMYGPVFTLLIAPFTWFPDSIAVILWVLFNVSMLYWAIRKLPMHPMWQFAILVCCSHELMNHSSWLQVNALVCSFIILAFCFIQEQKEGRALFLIMLGAFIKVYGIVGLAFFLFSNRKLAFIGWAALWSAVFFFGPLVLTHSMDYLLQCYREWFVAIKVKDAHNTDLSNNYLYQDISAMGMFRRIFRIYNLKNLYFVGPAVLLVISEALPFRHWRDLRYRLYLLCSVLLFTVVFSSGAESPTFIIALPAICIWYFLQPKSKCVTAYFVFALLLTTFSYSDLFTPWLRNHVLRPYSLKALPSFITWCIIVVQIHRHQFLRALIPGSGPRMAYTSPANG